MSGSASRPLRAATYARVSRDEQAEKGYSLPEQAENLATYCRNLGLLHVCHAADDISNIIRQRPGLSRIERMAEAGELDLLVCVRLDRLCRINHMRAEIEQWFAERGVQVAYADQHFEATSSGKLQKGIMGEFAEYAYAHLREQTMAGRARKAKERGVHPSWCNLYGYRFITRALASVDPAYAGRDGELEIIPEEAEHIRRIFAWYLDGRTLRQIAAALNAEGLRCRRGGAWAGTQVRNVLTNSTYAGSAAYGRREAQLTRELTASGEPRVSRRDRPESEWLQISTPAIVSREEWDRAQQRLALNREVMSGRPSGHYPLSGVIFCGECVNTKTGEPLRWCGERSGAMKKVYYACGSYRRTDRAGCKGRISAADAEEAIRGVFEDWKKPGYLVERRLAQLRESCATNGPIAARVARLEAQIEKTYQEEDAVLLLAAQGFPERAWRKRIGEIEEIRASAERELADARGQLSADADEDQIREAAERAASFARWWLDHGTLTELRGEIRVTISRGCFRLDDA